MEPYGDSNKSNSTRESRTKRELNEWRASEKPASGAPVHKEIKQPKPQKPKSDEPKPDEKTAAQVQTDGQSEYAARGSAHREAPRRNPAAREPQAPAAPKRERTVTIDMPPFVKTALLAVLCVCMAGGLVWGAGRLLPRMGIDVFGSADDGAVPTATVDPNATPLPTVDPNATPTPTPDPNATPDPDATIDPNATADPNATLDPNATPDPNAPIVVTGQAEVYETTVDESEAHVIYFHTEDGNIFISALNESFPVVNGEAVVTIPDSTWFEATPANDAAFNVELSPVLTTQMGETRVLDEIAYSVDVPSSPLEIIKPEGGYEEVLMSLYTLQMRVTPGSYVTVNGNDMSDFVDKRGYLSVNQTIEPIGDNVVNITVLTPSHKETRAQVTIYRPVFDIPLELDINTIDTTSSSKVTISGTFEPGATLTVSPQPVNSQIDTSAGTFKFEMNLTLIGDNKITITASEPGKESSVITHNIYYLPTEAEYSSKAWKMDYDALSNYYKGWIGRIFLCQGTVKEILPAPTAEPDSTENSISNQLLLLDVGSGKEQIVYIENYSSLNAEVGKEYKMFADVAGIRDGYPYLIARYVYEVQ